MALINREQALSHPFANGHYDKKHADLHFILGFEDYKEWLEDLPTVEAYTKDEVIAMLEELKKTIDSKLVQGDELFDDEDKWGYGQGYQSADVDTCDIIQERINVLKGAENGINKKTSD